MHMPRLGTLLNSFLPRTLLIAWLSALSLGAQTSVTIPVDMSEYNSTSLVRARLSEEVLTLRWNLGAPADGATAMHRSARGKDEHGVLELNLIPGKPLIRTLGIAPSQDAVVSAILRDVDPVTILTIGKRDLKRRRGWTIFFDKVHKKPHTTHLAVLDLKSARVVSNQQASVTVALAGLKAGPFKGELLFTLYPSCRLVHVEAVLSTEQNGRAIVYDAGIVSTKPAWRRTVWLNPKGELRGVEVSDTSPATPLAVKHRVIAAESDEGSVAVFPAPHQYFYPLDSAANFKFAWQGKDVGGSTKGFGLGFRQPLDGDNRYVPWFNAPPGTKQRLSAFYVLSSGTGSDAIEAAKRFTHGDQFQPLKGHRTFTSHYHVEHTLQYLKRQKAQGTTGIPKGLIEPGFVKTFKAMGVEIAHLAEFHNRRTPFLKTSVRLKQLKLMHDECERLSTREFLLLPGEEPNVHLGGHWINLFPKPVYWVLNRGKGAPFVTQHDELGTVYHVGNSADVLELFKREQGLKWTAHPRIKSSTGFPDAYAEKDYFVSDTFLGAAWKAMPADLSKSRLGTRVLDLQDDMLNWGHKKFIIGEVDVFKIEPQYELYAHMNVNYLRLNQIPRYQDGWQPVLDCLRQGKFFVTTGEVLIEELRVNGKLSGETATFKPGEPIELRARVQMTFPLAFCRLIAGDGKVVKPLRQELPRAGAFRTEEIRLAYSTKPDGFRPKWIRFEVWDIAGNGAFAPPVWLDAE